MFSKVIGGRSSPHAVRAFIGRLGLVALLVACVSLSACTDGDPVPGPGSPSPSIPNPGSPSATMSGSEEPITPQPSPAVSPPTLPSTSPAVDPEDVPPDDTDYSQDVGNTPQLYEYSPEPEPPESVVATLCNLNQVFFKGLRTTESGEAIADSTLRTSTVALSDLTDYWDTLRVQYPDAVTDIDTGIAVQEQWKTALLDQENGDEPGAKIAMAAAEDLIGKLPKVEAADCRR